MPRDVSTLLEALPYIRQFHGQTIVIKYGGAAMVDEALRESFARDVVLLKYVGMHPVIVHGGGNEISEHMDKLGLDVEFVEGLRVTNQDTVDVAKMVLIGKVNSDVVTALNRFGPVALGLSGTDAQLLTAAAHDPELGFVGQVTGVDTTLIERTLAMDLVPVIATIGADAEGQAYNINADDVASSVAEALGAEKLIMLTDVPGLLADVDDPSSLIQRVSTAQVDQLVADGTVAGGMVPKLEGCAQAISNGVGSVHLIDGRVPHALLLELFTDAGVGTMVHREEVGP